MHIVTISEVLKDSGKNIRDPQPFWSYQRPSLWPGALPTWNDGHHIFELSRTGEGLTGPSVGHYKESPVSPAGWNIKAIVMNPFCSWWNQKDTIKQLKKPPGYIIFDPLSLGKLFKPSCPAMGVTPRYGRLCRPEKKASLRKPE
jgi:hypothetical protein